MNAKDQQVIASVAARQAELRKNARDLTQEIPPLGSTHDSIRREFPGLSDEMLNERATFNLKDHMANAKPAPTLDLTTMSAEELRILAQAADQQATMKEKT